MPFDKPQRTTRRRSSAGPVPPGVLCLQAQDSQQGYRQGPRPTFLTLRDHGKVFVADLPHLSDGQLAHIGKEARRFWKASNGGFKTWSRSSAKVLRIATP